jgi:hypothetical protein
LGYKKGNDKGKIYSYDCLHKKKTEITNKKPNAPPGAHRKKKRAKSKISSWKEIMKIRIQINEIRQKKLYEESIK